MAKAKLRAEWFWCDRWTTSDAFTLPIAARGLYREMLTQAWVRGGSLPSDPARVRRAVGVTAQEWKRLWPKIREYWVIRGDRIFNPTQQEVMETSKALSKARAKSGAKGGARAQANKRAKSKPPSPSPSLSKPPNPLKRGNPLLRRLKRGGSAPDGHQSWDAFFGSLAQAQNCSAETARARWVDDMESNE